MATTHAGVYLRQLTTGTAKAELLVPYRLFEEQQITIGRDPTCQIHLDPYLYNGVSRHHFCIRPHAEEEGSWEVCDLESANGTYLNQERLVGAQKLQSGDHIQLGLNGPEFVFEDYETVVAEAPDALSPDKVTFTQLFPLAGTGKDFSKKAYLVPASITVVFVVLMFTVIGTPLFNLVIAAYLAGAAYYFVYRLCGKRKPWWVLVASGLLTCLIIFSPLLFLFILVFRGILPGNISDLDAVSFPVLFIRMFFGAGLMEELLKAIPILLAYAIGRRLSSPWREKIGVIEPLDGILLGAASAVGFTLIETLGQYVPSVIQSVALQAGEGAGQLVGLQLLIPRIIGSVAGHMAYTGYFGYFIGLSVLKPGQGWRVILIGYLSSSLLHALWNTTGFYSPLWLALVGVLSYAFLSAAILKARQLSPTRNRNFATRMD